VRQKKWGEDVVGEIQKAENRGVSWSAYQLHLHNGKGTLAAMYLRRVRVASRAAVGRISSIDGLQLVSN
jgi:hypothetical protein